MQQKESLEKWWLSPINQMIWIYKTIIIPILGYGSVVWAMNLTKSQIAKFSSVQHNMITRCKICTPKVVLGVMFIMKPLTTGKQPWINSSEKGLNSKNRKTLKHAKNQFRKIPNNTRKIEPFSLLNKTTELKLKTETTLIS